MIYRVIIIRKRWERQLENRRKTVAKVIRIARSYVINLWSWIMKSWRRRILLRRYIKQKRG